MLPLSPLKLLIHLFSQSTWINDGSKYSKNTLNAFAAIKGGFFSILALLIITIIMGLLEQFTPLRVMFMMMLGIILMALPAFLLQMYTCQIWREGYDMYKSNCARLTEMLDEAAENYADVSELHRTITSIPSGWMSSYGIMNVSGHNSPNYTGPVCFLWKPDVVVKDGKSESRCVTGRGTEIVDAIKDAIKQTQAYD